MILYCLIGLEIFKLSKEFKLSRNDHLPLASTTSADKPTLDDTDSGVAPTVSVSVKSQAINDSEKQTRTVGHISGPRTPQPINDVSNYESPKQRAPVSFRQYILMPLLFFIALLITWVTPTINRISAFRNPGYESYPLLLSVSAMGSLRGFWNGVIFITIGMKGWKRRSLEKRRDINKVSKILCSNKDIIVY
jgi:hypothetical protein